MRFLLAIVLFFIFICEMFKFTILVYYKKGKIDLKTIEFCYNMIILLSVVITALCIAGILALIVLKESTIIMAIMGAVGFFNIIEISFCNLEKKHFRNTKAIDLIGKMVEENMDYIMEKLDEEKEKYKKLEDIDK